MGILLDEGRGGLPSMWSGGRASVVRFSVYYYDFL
jgi:hypothetical protein